ncbi:MAG: TIGR03667 family PPOX class F420-dependent oxidoreductase [Catenulispora sp.]|nr:TIGR03667 family PPOX class F420-dependent oxidoreductase [Catenulispora sp.]
MIDTPHVLPDPATEFGAATRRRLLEEEIIWLVTINGAGVPQPNPVWFLWTPDEGDAWGDGSFLIFHKDNAARLRSMRERPTVALHFDGGVRDLEVMVFTGDVEFLAADHPGAGDVPEFEAKYRAPAAKYWGTTVAEGMAPYSVATRIRPAKVRGF